MAQPLILANGEIKDAIIQNGIEMLRAGKSAADVAEQVARDVEDDADDTSVGFSGLPNVLGEVQLDASFMDGNTLGVGAVASIHDYRHPISIARAVMERLPHVLLVGEGANRFAAEINAERRVMLTPKASGIWRERMQKINPAQFGYEFKGDVLVPAAGARAQDLIAMTRRAIEYNEGGDTMNVLVRGADGSLVTAVTTSGIAWKYPGRAGDSPIPGAGNYCDSRFGAAACMGLGELTMRHGTCLRSVIMLQQGRSVQEVGESVSHDIIALQQHMRRGRVGGGDGVWIRTLIMDAHGNFGGFSTADHELTYKVQRVGDVKPVTHACWSARPIKPRKAGSY